jgi:hypothetical protein
LTSWKQISTFSSGIFSDNQQEELLPPSFSKDRPLLDPFKLKADMTENTVIMMNNGSLLGTLTGNISRKTIADGFNCGCSSG